MRYFFLVAAAAVMLAACQGKQSTATDATAADEATRTLVGQWNIENVVLNDSTYARPAELTPDTEQYVVFEADNHYAFHTNCNTIQGSFTEKGDSLTIEPGLMTRMACENMEVEDLLCRIIPDIKTVDYQNDSIARLNTDNSAYIVLRKAE